jgi:DNA-directed RNA polymerase specialized sigma24 family protein
MKKKDPSTICGVSMERATKLIGYIASRYHKSFLYIPAEDLFQEGWLAILHKEHRWDPQRGSGTAFITRVVVNKMNNLRRSWLSQTKPGQLSVVPPEHIGSCCGEEDMREELSVLSKILSPLAWCVLSLKLDALPNRLYAADLCKVLDINVKVCAGINRELRQSLELAFPDDDQKEMLQKKIQFLCD